MKAKKLPVEKKVKNIKKPVKSKKSFFKVLSSIWDRTKVKFNASLISQIIAIIVILTSILVMFGWFLDIPSLKSILPGWVSMKFITALTFFFCGILIYLFVKTNGKEVYDYASIIISFFTLLLMIVFLVSLFTGISTGIESLFVKEAAGTVKTTIPGVPAIPTIVCFILIGLTKLIVLIDNNKSRGLIWMGIPVTVLGGLAILGYIFNVPFLYYSWKGFTSMAAHTAILFVLIGISFILLGKNKPNNTNNPNMNTIRMINNDTKNITNNTTKNTTQNNTI